MRTYIDMHLTLATDILGSTWDRNVVMYWLYAIRTRRRIFQFGLSGSNRICVNINNGKDTNFYWRDYQGRITQLVELLESQNIWVG